ncbi:MAG: hypothetical protein ABW104_12635 [Candidatus Thiodiazotropha sp. 6PLUC2]
MAPPYGTGIIFARLDESDDEQLFGLLIALQQEYPNQLVGWGHAPPNSDRGPLKWMDGIELE